METSLRWDSLVFDFILVAQMKDVNSGNIYERRSAGRLEKRTEEEETAHFFFAIFVESTEKDKRRDLCHLSACARPKRSNENAFSPGSLE